MASNKGVLDWRPGPEVERAYGFDMAFCDESSCGLHIVPKRRDGTAICEIVMSAGQTLALVDICKDWLYDKATQIDETRARPIRKNPD